MYKKLIKRLREVNKLITERTQEEDCTAGEALGMLKVIAANTVLLTRLIEKEKK